MQGFVGEWQIPVVGRYCTIHCGIYWQLENKDVVEEEQTKIGCPGQSTQWLCQPLI